MPEDWAKLTFRLKLYFLHRREYHVLNPLDFYTDPGKYIILRRVQVSNVNIQAYITQIWNSASSQICFGKIIVSTTIYELSPVKVQRNPFHISGVRIRNDLFDIGRSGYGVSICRDIGISDHVIRQHLNVHDQIAI